MKKTSTVATEGNRNRQPKLTLGFGFGRSVELVLHAQRSWGGGQRTEGEHHAESDAGGVRSDAAQPYSAGDGDALTLGEPVAERVGA